MNHVDVDMREFERLSDELDRFAAKAVPHAARNGLNDTAFQGRQVWQKAMGREFTLRNKWVPKSIRVEKAEIRSRVDSMHAVLGSMFPGLDKQEFGGTIAGKTGNKPIPTRVAAGQSMGAGERTRTVRAPNRLSRIHLPGRKGGGSKRQRNAIAVRKAARTKRGFALIETTRGNAIVKVTGRKRLRVRMVYDLSRASVQVQPSPTLSPTLKIMQRRMPSIMLDSLKYQARRHGLFGY